MVITGLSGLGKWGQRRYVESLSAYARQFLEQMEKPDVDSIEGLSPAISIEQKTTSKNPRSTGADLTDRSGLVTMCITMMHNMMH